MQSNRGINKECLIEHLDLTQKGHNYFLSLYVIHIYDFSGFTKRAATFQQQFSDFLKVRDDILALIRRWIFLYIISSCISSLCLCCTQVAWVINVLLSLSAILWAPLSTFGCSKVPVGTGQWWWMSMYKEEERRKLFNLTKMWLLKYAKRSTLKKKQKKQEAFEERRHLHVCDLWQVIVTFSLSQELLDYLIKCYPVDKYNFDLSL